jgi:hypothetical protein
MKKETMSNLSPVMVQGHLDPALGRWRWLIKWFLAIPHLIVLVFLWIAFIVLTVVAGVAIAITGRYPRGLFDFNVGVMRWSWRVQFYAFTLATDHYPPFTLKARPGDAARLEIEYPERLSRGLVWVKWWLLVLPHYLVIAAFTGGGSRYGGGLIALLSLIAGVTLAVTRTYPSSIFDFVMGMHRWSYRVIAYAALMRDEYPPFRIDNGPDEPGDGPLPELQPAPPLAA